MKNEPYIWRVECTAAKRYKAKKEPTCGCQKCWEKWRANSKVRRGRVATGEEA